MKWIKYILIPSVFLCLMMVSAACKFQLYEEVAIPAQKSVLAIETQFYLGEEPFVIVTRTRSIGEKIKWDFNYKDIIEKTKDTTIYNAYGQYLFDTVKNVTVQLYEAGSLIQTFKQYSPYLKVSYLADRVDYKKNIEYTLKVFAPDFDTVIGRQKAPSPVNLIRAEFTPNKIPVKERNIPLGELNLVFDDLPNEENYYTVEVLLAIGPQTNRVEYPLFLTKVDGSATNNRFLNDKTFDGKKHIWRVGVDLGDKLPPQKDSAELKVYFRSTSKDADLYQKAQDINNSASQSDFAEPTSSYSNLKGGVGVFVISSYASPYTIKL
jgi:hypothetical protein